MTQPPPIVPGRPVQPAPAQRPTQAPPPKPPATGMPAWAWITITAVAALTVGGCFYGFLSMVTSPGGGSTPAERSATVDVSNCTTSDGFYKASVHITNNRTRTASYAVTIEWSSSGTRLATDVEYFNDLGAGQSAISDSIATGTGWSAGVTCHFSVR